jgi:hypothetical protein
VIDQSEFRRKIERLSELIADFGLLPDSPVKAKAEAVLQLLMEVHAQGLARVLEITSRGEAAGDALIAQLGRDDVAGALLLLYSLHPEDLESRVQSAVERMRPQLLVRGCDVAFERMDDRRVRLRVIKKDEARGSRSRDVRTIIENAVFELAPDVSAIEIVGLESLDSSGFVALETLLATASAPSSRVSRELSTASLGRP